VNAAKYIGCLWVFVNALTWAKDVVDQVFFAIPLANEEHKVRNHIDVVESKVSLEALLAPSTIFALIREYALRDTSVPAR
jgi:hypothetical protein